MFRKMYLKSDIKKLENQILEIEAKRSRSQSELVSAILQSREPAENDVEFFNTYTKQIDEIREKVKRKIEELESL
jgi:hypothetical protein